MLLKGKHIVLGVTGSIAAYKIASLASMLVKKQADVTVIMTPNATNFINPITFESLTGNKCLVDTFDRNFQFQVEHVALAKLADVFLVAPASANVIAKAAHGIADDMLTTTLLACQCPKIFAPAMNTRMYENPIVQDNIEKLKGYGMEMITPSNGYLACGDTGAGKMPEPETLFEAIVKALAPKDLAGKKVLVVDADPQASLSISLGHHQPDTLPVTLSDMMGKVLTDQPIAPGEGILHHPEGVDLMPANIELSGMEVSLVNAMSRETILRQYLDTVRRQYTHILIDCQPSLGMLTINALAAANRIIIPVLAEYLPAKGLEQLLQTVGRVRRQINPKLQIDGILLAMVDNRTNFAKEIGALLRETYGSAIKVFATEIPHSVRAKEASAVGKSIYAHDPTGKVAAAYENLTKEVLRIERQRDKRRAEIGR